MKMSYLFLLNWSRSILLATIFKFYVLYFVFSSHRSYGYAAQRNRHKGSNSVVFCRLRVHLILLQTNPLWYYGPLARILGR